MYKSKKQVESKLAQAKYVLKEMQKYRGKVFVNNGIDQETGANPLQVNVSSFLAHTRSMLQYAYKECKEHEKVSIYEVAVNKYPIIAIFRELRNIDIHEMVVGAHTVVSCEVRLFKTEDEEKESSEANPKEATIENHISKPIIVTDDLIEQLRNDGRSELAEAAEAGQPLYETVEFEGEKNLYPLCEKYINNLNGFVGELVLEGVVS